MNWQSGEAPAGWVNKPLEDLAEIVGGGTPKTAVPGNFSDEEGHPWITPADLTGYSDKYISRGRRFLTDQGLKSSSAKYMPAGSVLFSSRAPIGYVAIASNPVTTNQGFRSVLPAKEILSEYLFYALKFVRPAAEQFASGTTFAELSATRLGRIRIAYPKAKEEQRFIANVLDKAEHIMHSGKAHLHAAQALTSSFERSVLNSAIAGSLTEEWRERHELEPLEIDRDALDSLPRKRRQAVDAFESSGLTKLPPTWIWVPLAAVADSVLGKMLDRQKNKGSLHPYLRNINVRWREFDLSDVHEMPFEPGEEERYGLRIEDVLVCEGGHPGRAAVWRNQREGMRFQKAIHRVRCEKYLRPDWLVTVLEAHASSGLLERYFTGTGIAHLTGVSLAKVPIPLPPIEEQNEINNRVEQLLETANLTGAQVAQVESLVEAVHRRVLGKAFRGELVRVR